MTVSGTTVTADPRRGLISIKNMDGMISLVWKDRSTGVEDQPFILFPEDAVFRQCKSCPTGRVFYLKFANDRREFFWMQELTPINDQIYCTRVNDIINSPAPEEPVAAAQSALAADIATATPQDQAHLRQMFGMDATLATPAVTSTPYAPPPLARPAPAQTSAASADAVSQMMAILAQHQRPTTAVDLNALLAPANVEPLLENPEVVTQLAAVLPPGTSTAAQVRQHIRSPQYAQALAGFNAAMQTGQIDSIVGQFGVDPSVVAANGGGVAGLCAALQQQAAARASAPAPTTPAPAQGQGQGGDGAAPMDDSEA